MNVLREWVREKMYEIFFEGGVGWMEYGFVVFFFLGVVGLVFFIF